VQRYEYQIVINLVFSLGGGTGAGMGGWESMRADGQIGVADGIIIKVIYAEKLF
jgi:hypothetical protein